ncbi:MAG: VOC family protein [Chloroflexota bacterium]
MEARPPRAQTLIAVRDVEASSRWYQRLLGLRSDHGGQQYERLVSNAGLVLQLHDWEVEHDHGRIGDPTQAVGNGVLLWFGELADFDAVVQRATEMQAPVMVPPHINGPAHRELWIKDPDGYTVVLASTDGEAFGVQ